MTVGQCNMLRTNNRIVKWIGCCEAASICIWPTQHNISTSFVHCQWSSGDDDVSLNVGIEQLVMHAVMTCVKVCDAANPVVGVKHQIQVDHDEERRTQIGGCKVGKSSESVMGCSGSPCPNWSIIPDDQHSPLAEWMDRHVLEVRTL